MIFVDIVQVIGLAIVATVIIAVIKAQRPEIAIQISIAAGIIVFTMILGKISAVIELLNSFAERININTVYISTLLKIVGIAYIAEFGAEVCKDAGESAIASKVELAGKVVIIVLAVPILTSLMDLIVRIIAN